MIEGLMKLMEQHAQFEHASVSLEVYKYINDIKVIARHLGHNSLIYHTSIYTRIEISCDRRLQGMETVFYNNNEELDKYFHDKAFSKKISETLV